MVFTKIRMASVPYKKEPLKNMTYDKPNTMPGTASVVIEPKCSERANTPLVLAAKYAFRYAIAVPAVAVSTAMISELMRYLPVPRSMACVTLCRLSDISIGYFSTNVSSAKETMGSSTSTTAAPTSALHTKSRLRLFFISKLFTVKEALPLSLLNRSNKNATTAGTSKNSATTAPLPKFIKPITSLYI